MEGELIEVAEPKKESTLPDKINEAANFIRAEVGETVNYEVSIFRREKLLQKI